MSSASSGEQSNRLEVLGRRYPEPGVLGRRYAPILLLVLAQLVLAAIVPSTTSSGGGVQAAGTPGLTNGTASGAGSGSSAVGAPGGAGGADSTNPALAGGASADTGSSGTSSAGNGSSLGSGSGGAAGTAAAATASGQGAGIGYSSTDRSKCASNGQQIGPTVYMPQCVPVWHGGNNGGATMTGATATTIRYIYYAAGSNTQVNAIEGVNSNSNEMFCLTLQAYTNVVNKRFELYGRKLVSVDGPGADSGAAQQSPCKFPYFQSQCPLTPPDPACDRAEADVIASLHPTFVIAPVAHDTVLERLAQDHLIVVGASGGGQGGDYLPEKYFDQLAPFYYNIFPNGTELMGNLGAYYCQKLSGHPVGFAGLDVLHPVGSNPTAAPPTRRVAVVYPENNGDPSVKISADLFVQDVTGGMCGSAKNGTQEFAYASNITTAQQQSTTLVAGLKQDKITTVACFCDSLAPIFLSGAMDSQSYHPEILIPGGGFLDNDASAQLYNPNVWRYAFGPSELPNAAPITATDAQKAWIDGGGSGTAGSTAALIFFYYVFIGNAVQDAGLPLTPATIESGLRRAPPEGGSPNDPTVAFRTPHPWNALNDFREVYYCPTTRSASNNQAGAYVPVAGGARHPLEQWQPGTSELFPGGPCA